jgi:hypothetical protein
MDRHFVRGGRIDNLNLRGPGALHLQLNGADGKTDLGLVCVHDG